MGKYIIIGVSLLFLLTVAIILFMFVKSINKNDEKVKKAAPKMVIVISIFAVIIILFGLGVIAVMLTRYR